MRKAMRWVVGVAFAIAAWPLALCAAYPERPVKILVGYSAGTTSDVFARIIGQKLAEAWKRAQPGFELLLIRDQSRGSAETFLRNRQAKGEHVVRVKSGIDAAEAIETANQETRAGQQHERESDFGHDERIADPVMRSPGSRSCATLFQRFDQ